MPPGQTLINVLEDSLESPVAFDDASYDNQEKDTLLSHKTQESTRTCYVPARYVLAFWSFLGFINMFTLRMDLSIALLAMVENSNLTKTSVDHTSTPATVANASHSRFQWSEGQQDLLLGSFFYGYCSTQILGGYLSSRISSKLILGGGILVTSILSLVTPISASKSYYLMVVNRVLQGLAQGLAQPCMHTMWSKWAPEKEKSWLMTITYAGCQVGTVVATWATGYMSDSDLLGGWPLVFYFYGGCGVLWSLGWLAVIHDTPAKHPGISEEERRYIEANVPDKHGDSQVKPNWCKILRSPTFLAIALSHFANDWGGFALTVSMPSYLHRVLHFHITQNGFLSSLPFIALAVTNPLSGFLADLLRGRNILSTKNTRKLMNSIGLFIPSVLVLCVCLVDADRTLIVVLLTTAIGVSGFTMAGYSVNHLDVAPEFAGLLFGVANSFGTTSGFIGPAILAACNDGGADKQQWNLFFYISAGVFFIGGLAFLIFAEGEPQDWCSTPSTPRSISNNHSRRTVRHSSINYGLLNSSSINGYDVIQHAGSSKKNKSFIGKPS